MRHTSTYRVLWTNKTSDISQMQTIVYFMEILYILIKFQYGAQFRQTE